MSGWYYRYFFQKILFTRIGKRCLVNKKIFDTALPNSFIKNRKLDIYIVAIIARNGVNSETLIKCIEQSV